MVNPIVLDSLSGSVGKRRDLWIGTKMCFLAALTLSHTAYCSLDNMQPSVRIWQSLKGYVLAWISVCLCVCLLVWVLPSDWIRERIWGACQRGLALFKDTCQHLARAQRVQPLSDHRIVYISQNEIIKAEKGMIIRGTIFKTKSFFQNKSSFCIYQINLEATFPLCWMFCFHKVPINFINMLTK